MKISLNALITTTQGLVDEVFPKGQCQERGKALVLYSLIILKIHKMLAEQGVTDDTAT